MTDLARRWTAFPRQLASLKNQEFLDMLRYSNKRIVQKIHATMAEKEKEQP